MAILAKVIAIYKFPIKKQKNFNGKRKKVE